MSNDWTKQTASFNEVIRQRDNLLAACKQALDFIDAINCKAPDEHPFYKQSAIESDALQAAIAKVERSAP